MNALEGGIHINSHRSDHEDKEVTVAQAMVPKAVSLAQPLAEGTCTLPIS